jgi:hypothetical protein
MEKDVIHIEAGVGDIVVDTDGEMILGFRLGKFIQDVLLTIAGVNSLEESP